MSIHVLAFITSQRAPRRGPKVVRLEDGEGAVGPYHQASAGQRVRVVRLSARARRRGVSASPAPLGLATRGR